MGRTLFLITVIMAGFYSARSQDSVRVITDARDTVLIKSYAKKYDPRKALLYSAVLPGLGQIYNKKYWKLPLVFGGLAVCGYAVNFYQEGYHKFRGKVFDLLENPTSTGTSPDGYSLEQLRYITDRYRRERDYFIIVSIGVYILQIIDAHVDAHLKEFDLNPDLQVSISPYGSNEQITGMQAGLSLNFKFR